MVTLKDNKNNSLVLSQGNYKWLAHWNDAAVSIELAENTKAQSEPIADNQAIVYKHGHFDGYGQYDIIRYEKFDFNKRFGFVEPNNSSSCVVGDDARLILHLSNNQTAEFWRGSYPWVGDTLNDKAVVAVVTPFDAQNGQIPDVTVKDNFPVDKVTFSSETNNIGDRITLGTGEYDYHSFGNIGNQNISSMHVPSGFVVTVHHAKVGETTDARTKLVRKVYTEGTYNDLGEFNDSITAVTIEKEERYRKSSCY